MIAESKKSFNPMAWGTDILKVLIGIILRGGILRYIQYFRQKKDTMLKKIAEHEADMEFEYDQRFKKTKKAEEIYCAALKEELGFIHMLGSPQLESKAVKLEEAFVSLRISQQWRSENRFEPCQEMDMERQETGCHFSPEEVGRILNAIGERYKGMALEILRMPKCTTQRRRLKLVRRTPPTLKN